MMSLRKTFSERGEEKREREGRERREREFFVVLLDFDMSSFDDYLRKVFVKKNNKKKKKKRREKNTDTDRYTHT